MRLRKNIGLALLVSFVAIAVFGFAAMGNGYGHTHGGCIAATANGIQRCQGPGENAASLLFHLRTFKSFSQALIVSALLLVGFFPVALFSLARSIASAQKVGGPHTYAGVICVAQLWQKTRRRIIYWLALHESRADRVYMGA